MLVRVVAKGLLESLPRLRRHASADQWCEQNAEWELAPAMLRRSPLSLEDFGELKVRGY